VLGIGGEWLLFLEMDSPADEVESDPPMLKGLDMEMLKRERQRLEAQSVPIIEAEHTVPLSRNLGEESEMAKKLRNILFNPIIPYPHMSGYEEKLDEIVNSISTLPIDSTIPESSAFFKNGRSKYVFTSGNTDALPLVVIKSTQDPPLEGYTARTSPHIINGIREVLKKGKKKKKEKLPGQTVNERTDLPTDVAAVDDDLDIFGGFSGASVAREKIDLPGPIFASNPVAQPEEDIETIRMRLVQGSQSRAQAKALTSSVRECGFTVSADDDFDQTLGDFGEKISENQFGVQEINSESKSKRKSKSLNDKEILKKLKES
jgi:hypothetical protein